MFSISIAFGNANWRLLFKTEEKAEKAYSELTSPPDKTTHFNPEDRIACIDDFGQRIFLKPSAIQGLMFENLDESKLANIEYGLHNAKTQAAFQQRAQSDPTLRGIRQAQGPGIISPMGNGFSQ